MITKQEIEYYAEQIVDFTRDTIGWRDPAEIRVRTENSIRGRRRKRTA